MSWFRSLSANPYDNDVEKITNEKNTKYDHLRIKKFCHRIRGQKEGHRECLKSIVKRLNHQDPKVQLQAIVLLDAVVNKCGKPFRLEIASREFETNYIKLLGYISHQKVKEKLKGMLRRWAEGDFKGDSELSLIPSLYNQLKKDGIDFSSAYSSNESGKRSATSLPKDPNVVSNQQEKDDIAKAIQLSLQENKLSSSQQPTRSSSYLNTKSSSNQEGLKMQIESVKNESMEIIKSHKETMAKVLNGSKPKDNACLDKGHWITAEEMLIGWKPTTESYEGPSERKARGSFFKLDCKVTNAKNCCAEKVKGKHNGTNRCINNPSSTNVGKMIGKKEKLNPSDLLECPICYEMPLKPIYQCLNGHLICHVCHSKVKICPICVVNIDHAKPCRNLTAEYLIDGMFSVAI